MSPEDVEPLDMPLLEEVDPVPLMLPVDDEVVPGEAMVPRFAAPVFAPALVLSVAVDEPVPGVPVMLPVEPVPAVEDPVVVVLVDGRVVVDGADGALSAALLFGLDVPALAPDEPLDDVPPVLPVWAYVMPTPPMRAAASMVDISDLVRFIVVLLERWM